MRYFILMITALVVISLLVNYIGKKNYVKYDDKYFIEQYLKLEQAEGIKVTGQLGYIALYCNKRLENTSGRLRDDRGGYDEFMMCVDETYKAYSLYLLIK